MVSHQPDVATLATIATVGTTLGDMGFTTETHASRATVAPFCVELGGINEGGHPLILRPPFCSPEQCAKRFVEYNPVSSDLLGGGSGAHECHVVKRRQQDPAVHAVEM